MTLSPKTRMRRSQNTRRNLSRVRRKLCLRNALVEMLEDRRMLAVWSSDIASDTTWMSDETQLVTSHVRVLPGVQLTIEPGTIVQFDSGDRLTVQGTLHAVGSETEKILFTSDRDDTGFDGQLGTADDLDTEGNGPTTGTRGNWGNIEFATGSIDNVLQHTEFRFGGGGSNGSIFVNAGPLDVSNTLVHESQSSGIRILDSSPSITDVSIRDNTGQAILANLGANPMFSNTSLENNDLNGMEFSAGSLPANRTWDYSDVALYLAGDVAVPADTTLTIGAGQVVKLSRKVFDSTDLLVSGTLKVQGTELQPVIFTSLSDDTAGGNTDQDDNSPAPGHWGAIQFMNTSVNSELDYLDVRYGGRHAVASVVTTDSAFALSNSIIRNSNQAGLRINNADPGLIDNRFVGNAGVAVGMDLASAPNVTGFSASGNSVNALALDGGELPRDTNWDNPDAVYWLASDVSVPAGTTLTIESGQIVKGDRRTSSSIGIDVSGTLRSEGTAARPVIFTSERDDVHGGVTVDSSTDRRAGDWNGIEFLPGSTNNLLSHTKILYAGRDQSGSVVVNDAQVVVHNSTVRDSSHAGLRIENASPNIIGSSFIDNVGAAISMDLGSSPSIHDVGALLGNAVNAVSLDSGEMPADASWNSPEVTYFLSGSILVPTATTLTIGAGQIVKGNVTVHVSSGLDVAGTLRVEGTETAPVILTSDNDDSVGNDVEDNGSSTDPRHLGGWRGINLLSASTGSQIEHAEIRYAGRTQAGAVVVNEAGLTIDRSQINGASGSGISIVNAQPIITNTTIHDATGSAAAMDLASEPIFSSVDVFGNGINALMVPGGELPADSTWNNPDIVYYVENDLTIPASTTLTIGAGQTIKHRRRLSSTDGIDFRVNGTLIAEGTPEHPVVFTALSDDSAGGDTDELDVIPKALIWGGLQFGSTSSGNRLDHVDVRYASQATGSNISVDGADLSLTNSRIVHARRGVRAFNGADVEVSNTIIAAITETGIEVASGANLAASNNTIDGGNRGITVDGADSKAELVNNLITFHSRAGLRVTGDGTILASFNDVYNPAAANGNFDGIVDLTGTAGNISKDPKYFNAASRQYGLRSGSPAIDAGTSNGVPTSDLLGNPRFDDPQVTNTGAGPILYTDIGALERQEVSQSSVDLRLTGVEGPATGNQDESVTVAWTGMNSGAGTAYAPWHDAVYLSTDTVWTPDDIFLGTAARTQDVGPGRTYENSLNAELQGVFPGSYHLLVRTDWQNEVFEGLALQNNTGISMLPIEVEIPDLTLGVPLTQQIGVGESKLFRVNVPASQSLNVELAGAEGDVHELYIRYADAPTVQAFDERGIRPDSKDQTVGVRSTQPGSYFVRVVNKTLASVGDFTLTATLAGVGITEVRPASGGNGGQVTLTLRGTQLSSGASIRLTDSAGTTIDSNKVYFVDSGLLSATFDLSNSATGPADIHIVENGNVTATASAAFEVTPNGVGQLVTNLITPSRVRRGRNFEVVVEYSNRGQVDLVAPLIEIRTQGFSKLDFSKPTIGCTECGESIWLVAVNRSQPAGILPPGASNRIVLHGRADANGDERIEIRHAEFPAGPIDYVQLEQLIRPQGMPDEEWNAFYSSLQASLGADWSTYQQRMADNATAFPAVLGRNYSLEDLFDLEVKRARAQSGSAVSGSISLEDGTPRSDVRISLYNLENSEGGTTVAATDGAFLFDAIQPGNYAIRVEGHVVKQPQQVEVTAAGIADLALTVEPASAISGRILSSNGMPLADTLVSATDQNGIVSSAVTDDQGVYHLLTLPAGSYNIRAGAEAYVSEWIDEVTLRAGEKRKNVNLVLREGVTIQGTVTGPAGPVANAQVTAFDEHARSATSTTDENGNYTIAGAPSRDVSVSAVVSGLVGAQRSVGDINGTSLSGVDLVLTEGGILEGTITTLADNLPVPFVILSLEGELRDLWASNRFTRRFLGWRYTPWYLYDRHF